MAIQLAQACKFPQDLDAAAFAIDQQLGDSMQTSFAQLVDIEADLPAIQEKLVEGTLLLNQLLANGDGSSSLKNTDSLSEQYGLPSDKPSQEESEKRLKLAGIPMVAGAIYIDGSKSKISGDSNNVEVLRRLYFASGRDLSQVEKFLKIAQSFSVHMRISLIKAPPKTDGSLYTISELREIYNLSYLDKGSVYIASDGSATILTEEYLATNQSKTQTKNQFGLTSFPEVTSSVFHYNEVDNSSPTVQRFKNYEFDENEMSAILQGVDLVNLSSNPVQKSIDTSTTLASSMISTIDFLLTRFSQTTPSTLQTLKSKLLSEIKSLRDLHLTTISRSLFQVTIIVQKDTLDVLRAKHTDEEIIYLLEKRKDIKGLYFTATDEEIQKALTQGTTATVGSTLVSNRFINQQDTEIISYSTLIKMSSDIDQAESNINTFTEDSIRKARQNLIDFGGSASSVVDTTATSTSTSGPSSVPISTTQGTSGSGIFEGQPSMETPGFVLFQYMGFDKSFNIKLRIKAVDDALDRLNQFYTESIAKPIATVIKMVTKFFENVMNMCKQLMEKARNAILPIKQQVDAFMSKFLSLTGSGSFETSLLKCAINFDIGLSTGLLDNLLALLDSIASLLGGMIGKLAVWLADLLEKILCLPFNLINSFLGNISVNLPSACQLPRVDLGPDLTDALKGLRNIQNMKMQVFGGFNKELIKYKAIVNSATDKLAQFSNSAACSTGAASNFYNASILNINGGIG